MHDVNGAQLKVGDKVMLPGMITYLCEGDEYCNVGVESQHGRRPDGHKETVSAINTGVLVLVERSQS